MEKLEHGKTSPPQITKQIVYGENQVTYMSDKVCHCLYSDQKPASG